MIDTLHFKKRLGITIMEFNRNSLILSDIDRTRGGNGRSNTQRWFMEPWTGEQT